MGRGSQADEGNREPEVHDVGREHDRDDTERAAQHRLFSSGIHAPAALDQRRGEPAAPDAADIRRQIDGNQRRADVLEVEPIVLLQEVRYPVKVEPPDRIGEELAEGKGPGLAVRQQPGPRDPGGRLRRVAPNVRELRLR